MSSEKLGEDFITQLLANGSVLGPFKVLRLESRGLLGELYLVEEKGRKLALNVFTADNIRAYQFANWLHSQKAYALVAVGRVAEIHYVAMEYHVGSPWFPFERLLARWERMPPIPMVYVHPGRPEETDFLSYAPAVMVVLGLAFITSALHKRAQPLPMATKPVVREVIVAQAPAFRSTTPLAMWLKKGEQPDLSWSTPVKDGVVEVSARADFRDIVTRETANGTRLKIARPLEDGRYYWRLNGGKPVEVTLSRNEPPRILAPLPGQVIDIPQTVASVPLTFAWRCKPGQSVYRVQISELPNFLNVLKDVVISGCQWPDVSLFPGAHFLRVRTEVPAGGNSDWSTPVPFRVQSN